jgi:hypothetical protein
MLQNKLPKPLGPEREWKLVDELAAIQRFGLYQRHTMPEGYVTYKGLMHLKYYGVTKTWVIFAEGWRMAIESEEPPFVLAEALYDARK